MPDKSIPITESDVLQDDLGLCSYDMMVLISLLRSKGMGLSVERLCRESTVKDLLNAINQGEK